MNAPKYPKDFEEFWKVYPRKVSKGVAFRAWVKLKPDREFQEYIIKAVKSHIEYWRKEGTEMVFIPHPSTWLNGGRYEDELGESESLMSDYEKEMEGIING